MMAAGSMAPVLRGELRLDAPLKGLTSWRVGGPAERLYRPADLADLGVFLGSAQARGPLTWLGLGSNLLVRDAGVRGTVIALHGALQAPERLGGRGIRVQAGVPCAKVARFAARCGLRGIEFWAGIPGTVGGALAMNAGAFGGETWERVVRVQTIDRHGRLKGRPAGAFQVGYRHVTLPHGEWFVGADLELEPGDSARALETIRGLLARRARMQPTGVASCGSVFRNPPGDHAARLIETSGLKGHCIGGACVSDKHANFIINTGTASAGDIEALIELIRDRVAELQGVALQPEVHIVGEARP
jgi:UDP-N-acetylmuramate dehydrogenase